MYKFYLKMKLKNASVILSDDSLDMHSSFEQRLRQSAKKRKQKSKSKHI